MSTSSRPYSGFYNYHLDTAIAVATSRDSNNEIHEMIQSWPERFAGLATLPMQDVNAAIAELERVMTQLGFKGAMIDDKINGATLDAPEFLPFWKAAEQLGAMILFHQGGNTVVHPRINRYHLPNTIGNPGGPRHHLRHAGDGRRHGTPAPTCASVSRTAAATLATASAAWTAPGSTGPPAAAESTQPPSDYLRRFYYDCIVYTESALRYLIDTVGVDRVVFGTDWPYDMEFDWPVSWILSLDSLTQDEKEAILWKNLERLLNL